MTVRSSAAALVAAAAVASLAACADSASSVTAPTAGLSASRSTEFNSPRHEFHTREYFARQDAADGGSRYARPSSGSGTGISYHGGTVLQNGTKVVAIYWGSGTYPVGYQNLPSGSGAGSADGSLIGTFLNSLGTIVDAAASKSYFNINSTYTGQTGVKITSTVAYTGYWNTAGSGAPIPSASPTDADMISLVNWGITNGKIAFYAAMPYNQQYPSGCTSQQKSANADTAANSEVNTLAHEIEETTTDDMGNAWYDTRGYENADKCAWTWGTTKTTATGGVYNQSANGVYFMVQQNWVNVSPGGCATGY